MKKIYAISSIFILLLFTSCNGNSKAEISKPNQEILFVVQRGDFSDDIYSTSAWLIDSDGNYHGLPDGFNFKRNDWHQVLSDAQKSESGRSIKQSHLNTIYRFVNKFDATKNYDTQTYELPLYDYGFIALYEIYMGTDGNPNYKLLCAFGDEITCINDEAVKKFVNWMADNDYFYIEKEFRY